MGILLAPEVVAAALSPPPSHQPPIPPQALRAPPPDTRRRTYAATTNPALPNSGRAHPPAPGVFPTPNPPPRPPHRTPWLSQPSLEPRRSGTIWLGAGILAQVLSQGGAVGGPGEPLGSLWDGVLLGARKGAGFSERVGPTLLAAPCVHGPPRCVPTRSYPWLPRLVVGGGGKPSPGSRARHRS